MMIAPSSPTSSEVSVSSISSSSFSSPMTRREVVTTSRRKSAIINDSSSLTLIEQLQNNILTNERFLLDFCLNYDWDVVDECCNLILRILLNAPSSSASGESSYQWYLIDEELIIAATKQLLAKDSFGNTILHAACYHKPPTKIIQLILQCCDEASQVAAVDENEDFKLHLMSNHHHETPLLISCLSSASKDAIHELLHPSKACSSSMSSSSVITQPDNTGRTTFQGIYMRYDLLRKLPPFRSNSLGSSTNSTRKSFTRSNTFSSTEDPSSSSLSDNDDSSSSSSRDHLSTFSSDTNESQLYNSFWDTIDMLLTAAWEDTKDVDTWTSSNILQRAAIVADCLPTKLIDMIIARYYDDMDDLVVNTTDNLQDLLPPLHLVVSTATRPLKTYHRHHPQLVHQRQYMMERLLEYDPSKATQELSDSKRTTFCQAIASGLHWHQRIQEEEGEGVDIEEEEDCSFDATTPCTKAPAAGPLQCLWNYGPEMIHTVDTVTGLYPFMLAAGTGYTVEDDTKEASFSAKDGYYVAGATTMASSSSKSNDEGNTDDDAKVLDTVYSLLRLYPQVINTKK